jgi:hypothetical protein
MGVDVMDSPAIPRNVRRTLAISCEAVPAFPSPRGHEPALRPRNGAAESFVSFIALFDDAVHALVC